MIVFIALVFLSAYLVGSIPTGYWFAKYFFGINIRLHGSGNIGATNVARVLGSIKYFFVIFFIDAGKAVLTLWIVEYYVGSILNQSWRIPMLCATAALLLFGNGFSIFLRGKGGKSVATLIGCIVVLFPWNIFVSMLILWGIVFALSRQVFIASIIASTGITIGYWCLCVEQHGILLGVFLSVATAWLLWRHTSNIKKFFSKG